MGIVLECSDCEHTQVVGMIAGGIIEIPDPHTVCGGCKRVGSFHFLPGAKPRIDPQVLEFLERSSRIHQEVIQGGEAI